MTRHERVRIRPAVPSDLDSLQRIEDHCYDGEGYEAYALRQFLDLFAGLSFVAETPNGSLCGYSIGAVETLHPDKGWFLSLAVLPEFRRKGTGRELTKRVMHAMADLGVKVCRLTVSPTNDGALRLYRELGWQEEHHVRDYFGPGKDRLVLRRNEVD